MMSHSPVMCPSTFLNLTSFGSSFGTLSCDTVVSLLGTNVLLRVTPPLVPFTVDSVPHV